MILQATKRNTIIASILASTVILAATINLVEFKGIDIDIKDFLQGFVVGICLVFIAIWAIALIKKEKNKEAEYKDLAINQVYLSIGMLSLVIGTVLKRINFNGEWILYVTGILFISSIIFNMIYLVGLRKGKKE